MEALLAKPETLALLCQDLDPASDSEAVNAEICKLMPALEFSPVASRGNWHRLGGVVDASYRPVHSNIAHWAERESGGDVDQLIVTYADAGYFATRLAGKTHYFTAPCGDRPESFIQLEVEQLQEVLDRPLVERDWFPESIEEFLDPLDYPRLQPEPIGKPYWQFRRITPVEKLLNEATRESQARYNLRRFFQDWSASSAGDGDPFCRHWVLALREYLDSDGEYRLSAKPFSTFTGSLSKLPPGDRLQGAALANAVHGYDRQVGYPFAWFFNMLSSHSENYTLAEAVLRDQMGAYDYLPAKDLKVLRQWEERPYGV